MARVSSSACRKSLGEPQAMQRPAPSRTSRRQSRQKPDISCALARAHVSWLRRIAFPGIFDQNITRRDDFIRIDLPFAGESEQQGTVADHVIKHAGEKPR